MKYNITMNRFILAICAGLSLLAIVGTNCYLAIVEKPLLEPTAVISIITAIVGYFVRSGEVKQLQNSVESAEDRAAMAEAKVAALQK